MLLILVSTFLLTFGYMSGRVHAGGINNLAEPRKPFAAGDLWTIVVSSCCVALAVLVVVIIITLILAVFGLRI